VTRTTAPSLTHVTLRCGTRYLVIEGDRLSEPRVLESDVEVEVRRLAFGPGEVAAYMLDGEVMLVAYEDEPRSERTV
jgi:hypothetical protein